MIWKDGGCHMFQAVLKHPPGDTKQPQLWHFNTFTASYLNKIPAI